MINARAFQFAAYVFLIQPLSATVGDKGFAGLGFLPVKKSAAAQARFFAHYLRGAIDVVRWLPTALGALGPFGPRQAGRIATEAITGLLRPRRVENVQSEIPARARTRRATSSKPWRRNHGCRGTG